METQQTDQIDWRSVIFDPDFMKRLELFSRKRFGDNVLAEEAYTSAFTLLIDPEWQSKRLSQYRGKSSPAGFVLSAFRMLLEDFARKRFGRPRPPAWLKRLGPMWVKLYKLLCLERLDIEAVLSRMQTQVQDQLEKTIKEATVVIRARVTNCGQKTGETPHDFNESEAVSYSHKHDGSDEYSDLQGRTVLTEVFVALAGILAQAEGRDHEQTVGQLLSDQTLRRAADSVSSISPLNLDISDEERLLLQMVYQDGRNIAETARIIQQPEHRVRRLLKRSVAELRTKLEQAGVTVDLLRDI